MVAWVQLPAFPVHFYHQEILFSLGNMIGRAIKLDFHTQHQQRVKFARMAVELDLSKPLVTRIRLDGKWQYIEYENLPKVCFECGKVGHTTASCPSLCESAVSIRIGTAAAPPEKCSEESSEEKAGFGPWMQVTRRSRRGTRGHEKGNSDINQGDLVVGGNAEKGKGNHKILEGISGSKGGSRETQGQRTENLKLSRGEKGKYNDGVQQKGKEKVSKTIVEGVTGGQGVLGPIPVAQRNMNSGANKPTLDTKKQWERGSTSLDKDNGPLLLNEGTGPRNGPELTCSSPPPTRIVKGPNDTSIQIVAIPPYESQQAAERETNFPSAAVRTKNQKGHKKKNSKSPRKTSVPITSKALQVWTPVKEKKNKARTRLASLTLQEIEAWTGAAKAAATETSPPQVLEVEPSEKMIPALETAGSD
ncbi:unnamed protein product [Linum tenue]|uniref:CCHC-type domain-containing protein n=1 Tax=Linum tenue TaxID=586396 RepID=A0AAV0R672_9ROSI|nr:unnamed protein product [Linum tenue]